MLLSCVTSGQTRCCRLLPHRFFGGEPEWPLGCRLRILAVGRGMVHPRRSSCLQAAGSALVRSNDLLQQSNGRLCQWPAIHHVTGGVCGLRDPPSGLSLLQWVGDLHQGRRAYVQLPSRWASCALIPHPLSVAPDPTVLRSVRHSSFIRRSPADSFPARTCTMTKEGGECFMTISSCMQCCWPN